MRLPSRRQSTALISTLRLISRVLCSVNIWADLKGIGLNTRSTLLILLKLPHTWRGLQEMEFARSCWRRCACCVGNSGLITAGYIWYVDNTSIHLHCSTSGRSDTSTTHTNWFYQSKKFTVKLKFSSFSGLHLVKVSEIKFCKIRITK